MSLSVPRTLQVPSPTEGRTQPSGQGLGYLQAPQADFSPLIRGLTSIGDALKTQELQNQVQADQLQRYKGVEQLNDTKTKIELERQNLRENVPLDNPTYAKQSVELANKHFDEFIAAQPPDQQERFRAMSSDDRARIALEAMSEQHTRVSAWSKQNIADAANQSLVRLQDNPNSYTEERNALFARIDELPVGALEKEQLKRQYEPTLATQAYKDTDKQKRIINGDQQGQVQFLLARSASPDVDRAGIAATNPAFRGRLQLAIMDAEAATGGQAEIRDMYRSGERQAQYRADYIHAPVVYNGKTYTPEHQGGLAAPPGHSQHQLGNAADLNDGAVLQWLRSKGPDGKPMASKYGLEFLPGSNDIGHIQLQKNLGDATQPIHNPDSFQGLVAAVRQAESSNLPGQVSSRGAAGFMQVMPATAGEIARELKDPNFPTGGTDDQIRAYLQGPQGQIYGEHYLKKQLDAFGGDREAALIAYNAGPETAKAWIAGGRDDSKLPPETQAYVGKVLGATGAPDNIDTDPRFASVPFEDRVAYRKQAESEANAELNRRAQQQKADEAAALNAMLVSLKNGTKGEGDWAKWQIDNPGMDVDSIIKGDSILKSRNEDAGLVAAGIARINDPAGDRNPGNAEIVKQNNALIGKDGIAALNKQDKNYFTHEFMSTVNKMGDIPTDALGSIEGQVRSTDVTRANNALDMLAQLQVNQPMQFEARTNPTIRDKLEIWKSNKDSMPPDQLMNKINPQGDPEFLRTRELADKAAEKALTDLKLNTAKDLPSMFWDTIAGPLRRGIPPPAGIEFASQAFYSDFKEGYKDGYFMSGGNEDQAMTMGTARVQANWGLGTNGHYIMKYPPDERRGYKQFDGSFSWQDDQLHKELGLPADVQTQLVSDRQTEQEVQNFKAGGPPPSYLVYYKRNDGNWDFKSDEQGKYRIRFEPSRALLTNETALFAVSNLKAQFEKFRTEVYNPISSAPSFGGMGVVPQKSVPPDIQQEYDSYVQRIGAAEKNLEGTRARVDMERYTFKPSVLPSEGSTPIDQPPPLY